METNEIEIKEKKGVVNSMMRKMSSKLSANGYNDNWLDHFSRKIFPAVFLIFNIVYWIYSAMTPKYTVPDGFKKIN